MNLFLSPIPKDQAYTEKKKGEKTSQIKSKSVKPSIQILSHSVKKKIHFLSITNSYHHVDRKTRVRIISSFFISYHIKSLNPSPILCDLSQLHVDIVALALVVQELLFPISKASFRVESLQRG
jgi:hypothetical protein